MTFWESSQEVSLAGADHVREREGQGMNLEWEAGQDFKRSVICAKEFVLYRVSVENL